MIPRSPLMGKRIMQPFVHFFIVFCLYKALHNRSMSSNFLVFNTCGDISSGLQFFCFNSFSATSSSSSINSLSLISSRLLMIFMIGFSVTLGEFPSRFLKCSFNFCILSFWLAAFNFTLEVPFFSPTSFTVSRANRDCLQQTFWI